MEIELGTNKLNFKIDTGSDVSVINKETFNKLEKIPQLRKSDKILKSPGGSVYIAGMFDARIVYKGNCLEEKIYVLGGGNKSGNLLSRKASTALKIVKFLGSTEEENIFGFGKWMTEPVTLHLEEENKPYAIYAARKVPIPLMPKVKEALESMEKKV